MVEHMQPYLRAALEPDLFRKTVNWVVRVARKEKYDVLAACGHSGLLVAAAAAYRLGIPIIAVRKDGETAPCHDYNKINCVALPDKFRWAFVDDLIASGSTLRLVYDMVSMKAPHSKCAGIVLYFGLGNEDAVRRTVGNVPTHCYDQRTK